MPSKLRIDQVNYVGKRVLMRVDFDVPMRDGVILSKQRIVAALDSINYVLNNYCRAVILISHLGKPHGKRKEKYSLKPIQKELSTLLNKEVIFLDDCVGPEVEMAVMEPEEKSVFLLENVQFHPEELGEADGKGPSLQMIMEFRRSLRRLAEVYVNDTFSLSHLKHSSMLGEGYEVRAAGFLVLKELENFHDALIQPEVPFLAILGGDSLTDILPLMEALLLKVNEMIIAGGIVFTFLKVLENMEIGDSIFDPISAKKIPKLMEITKERKIQIHYPDDFWVAASPQAEPMPNPVRREKGIKPGYMGLDIGPKTLKNFAKIVRRAKILIWNGPVGAYDYPNFAQGTKEMVDYVVDQTVAHGITMINGEATVKAFEDSESTDQVTFISHGDDAAVALLRGRLLPSITSLTDADVYCRQKCKVFQVIRPELENNPFGEVDVEKIRAERRQKREGEAQEAAGKETNKKNTVGGQSKTGSQPGKGSTTSSLGGSQGA